MFEAELDLAGAPQLTHLPESDDDFSTSTLPEDRVFTESLFESKDNDEPLAEVTADGRVDKL